MDPITAAIVAALSAGALSGLTDTGKKVIADAYDAIKSILVKKYGVQSEVVKSVANLEVRPGSPNRQGLLQEEIQIVHADQDPELQLAAQTLLEQIKTQSGGMHYIQNVIGNYNASSQGTGSATVNINTSKEP